MVVSLIYTQIVNYSQYFLTKQTVQTNLKLKWKVLLKHNCLMCWCTHKHYTHNVHTATYGVQEAEISEDSLLGSICITCIFARGTSAQGCYISLLQKHDSVATNTTGLRIEREDESLNATGCFENLEGGLYHVAVYDADSGGTVDWQNRALFLTAALNWTVSPNQLNTSKNTDIWTAGNNHVCILSYHSLLLYGRIHMLKGSHNLKSFMLGPPLLYSLRWRRNVGTEQQYYSAKRWWQHVTY